MNFVNTPTPEILEGYCLIKSLEKKTTAKGLTYLDLVLSDSSGEIVAKFWDYKENMHSHFEPNMLIKVRGRMNEYNGEKIRVVHIDAYRLKSGVEAYEAGLTENFGEKNTVCCIEWAENVADAIVGETLTINIKYTGEDTREIEIK